MRKNIITIILLLLAIAGKAESSQLVYSNDRPLLFGLDLNFPPLQYIDQNGQAQGYDVNFTRELMERLHIPMIYSPNTWTNVCDDVLSGRVDLAMMVFSPYRKDIINYSSAVFRLYYQILYRKDDSSSFDVRHLKDKEIAYMSSRPIHDTLSAVGAKLYEVTNLTQTAVSLSQGKYDAVICFRYQAKYLIHEMGLDNLVAEDMTLTPREYCYVSHDKALIDRINIELDKLEEEGRTQAIYGDVYATFDGIKIPDWIWYMMVTLIIAFLISVIILQKRHQKSLRKEMERAQYSERIKTAFLSNVSHALRTPLNAIIGFSDILKQTDVSVSDEERSHLAEMINNGGQQLLYFINEILQLSEFEGKELQFHRIEVNPMECLKGYATEVAHKLHEGVKMTVEGTENAVILVDEQLMRFVTMHQIENAIKYTEKGSITIICRVEHDMLYIGVKDTGSGVSEELKKNIFNLLSNESTFVQKEVPGLGLTICKAIVDRCGGQMGMEQPAEGGSLFWHTVPVKIIK